MPGGGATREFRGTMIINGEGPATAKRKERAMKFKPLALGLSLGIVWGCALFITTWLSYFTGYGKSMLEVLAGSIYPGYTISPVGSVLGFFYGFADLTIMGVLVGWIYNKIAG
jgi:hypothetical protein